MSHETFELIEKLRRAGRRAVMATLVRTKGTTPRKEGTKMFVGDAGDIFGSVTIGGCVDARVIERSHEVLDSSAPQLLDFQLGDEEAWEIGLTCGGAVDVFVEPLTSDVIDLYDEAKAEWDAGRTTAIATVVSGPESGKRFFVPDPPKSSGVTTLDGRDVYVEVLRPPATLVVFGASAVAIPLVTFAKNLGFRTVVVDGRAKFATRERFPDAGEIRIGMVSEIASQMQLGPATPVVLVAHDYKIDVPVLRRALATDVPYIGLLGSRRRGAAILQMLREDGVSDEQLSRIHNPVGLDLGGESAAEIALSIVSEIVAVTHGRSGGPLTHAHQPVR
ncbi:MAG TPA: XdhC/CoxI family protein [Thermoanaerobaculia bacterium]|nr:XdhC/CoxI family protein [Thermoanaerobaculia bacterium]